MTITEKLISIQSQLKVPKNQYNSYGSYSYRSCEDILEAVKPILAGEKLLLTISDDVIAVNDRIYIKATAILSDGTERIEISAQAREPLEKKGMDTAQITGATSSYARKYALNGLFSIDDTKDADTTNLHDKEKVYRQAKNGNMKVSKKTEEIKKAGKGKGVEGEAIDSDIAIFKGLSECSTIEELKAYFLKNHKKVNHKEAFIELKNTKKEAMEE